MDHAAVEDLILERLAKLTVEELANAGRPQGKPSKFVKVEGDLFTYEVRSKRIPAHHGDVAREMLQRGRKMNQTEEEHKHYLATEFDRMRTTHMTLSRKTVARNAVERIRKSLTEAPREQTDEATQ